MSATVGQRVQLQIALGDLLACVLAFAAIPRFFPAAGLTDWAIVVPVSAVSSWLAAVAFQHREFGLSLWVDQFFYAAGLTMLLVYGLAYAFLFRPAPLAATVAGTGLSIVVMAALRRWVYPKARRALPGVLFLGFDATAAALAPFFRGQTVGVVESDPARVPAGLPFLGPVSRLAEIVAEKHPGRIVVTSRLAPARLLLDLQYSGAAVIDGPALHETMLARVRWDRLRPMDLLFSRSTNADRLGMAVQSVYNNVVGLCLLLALAPLLFVVGGCVALASGGGPVLEHDECMGFQMIPYRLLRFGVRRSDGRPHGMSGILVRLHLVHLPRLINVVRGEMALFGPPPARVEFARRLGQLIPVYSHRFTIKPGLLGWSQANLAGRASLADEALRLEYDLYYVKQNSVSLDLEILLRSALPARPSGKRHAPQRPAGGL
ncbi:MAG: sugar transferase [Bryobacteraceae bacterium]|jgi:lipopolysaccharide/colanic/teichoic acid biosynthesis glycosyltransferase